MIRKYENISLLGLNTFGMDVRGRLLLEFENTGDLVTLYREGDIFGKKWSVLSGGSNILFTADYDGILLKPFKSGIKVISENDTSVSLHATAATEWNGFVDFCVDNGYWGAENLAYIPGLCGASPVQNIGAYGAEAGNIIELVEMFCPDNGKTLTLSAVHCDFGYRDSIFKRTLKGKVIITGVNYRLSKIPAPSIGYGDLGRAVEILGGPTLSNIRDAVTSIRRSKLPEPEEFGNAGSFFKNPVVEESRARELKQQYTSIPVYPCGTPGYSKLAAGWLIDMCGWKGRRIGNAGVHEKQALVLINYGGATGGQILEISKSIQADVMKKFGVRIEPEVNIL